MKLEWDEQKRAATLKDRGLDFADVALIDWDAALTLEDTRQPYPETRFITIAPIRDASAWSRGATGTTLCA